MEICTDCIFRSVFFGRDSKSSDDYVWPSVNKCLLQTKDDNTAESKQMYTLELTSASGGATLNSAAKSAQILVVASDYPHGLFEFSYPPEVVVQEESGEVGNSTVISDNSS